MNDRTYPSSLGWYSSVAAIVVLAAVLRFWALDLGLPNPRTRPDELPVVHEMAKPARGDFSLDMVLYPNAYIYATWLWVEAGLRVAPLFGIDPPGGFIRTLQLAPEQIFLIGRALSAAAGTAVVLLVMLLARRWIGRGAALAGGLLVATCFLHARDSHALKPDVLLSLTTTIALGACVLLAGRATLGRALLAGAAVGLAMATKYTGLLMIPTLYLAAVMSSDAKGLRRVVPLHAIVGGLAAGLVFAGTSPYLVFGGPLLDWIPTQLTLVAPELFPKLTGAAPLGHETVVNPDYGLPERLGLTPYGAHPWYHGLVYHARFSLWYGVGAIATILAPLAVVWGFAARHPLLVLSSLTCVVHYAVAGASAAISARYLTVILPILLLLEGAFLARVTSRFAPTHAAWALAITTALVCAQPLAAIVGHDRIASRTDTRDLATTWLAEHAKRGARLAFAGTVMMPYGQPVPPKGLKPVVVALDADRLAEARIDYVITHDHSLYYSSVDPEALARLAPRLRMLAEFDPNVPGAEPPIFEEGDAYYIPFRGFDRVERPGPLIRIYAFE